MVDTTNDLLWGFYYKCPYCSDSNGFNPNNSPGSFTPTGNTTKTNNSNGTAYGLMAVAEVGLSGTDIEENMLMAFITSEQGFSVGVMGLSNDKDFLNIFELALLNRTVRNDNFALAL
jgi:hypothetical protein